MYKHLRKVIKNGNKTFGLILAGGGSSVVPNIIEHGGMSKVFMGAEIPYSYEQLKQSCRYLTSKEINKAVSQDTADIMAISLMNKYRCNFVLSCTSSLYYEGQRIDRLNHAYLTIIDRTNGSVDYGVPIRNHINFNTNVTNSRTLQEKILSDFIMMNIEYYLTGNIFNLYISSNDATISHSKIRELSNAN